MMMSVMQRNLDQPIAIGLQLHRISRGIPIVKVAHERDVLRARRGADEIDGLEHFLGRVAGILFEPVGILRM